MNLVIKAMEFASEKHSVQTQDDGKPYYLFHIIPVLSLCCFTS